MNFCAHAQDMLCNTNSFTNYSINEQAKSTILREFKRPHAIGDLLGARTTPIACGTQHRCFSYKQHWMLHMRIVTPVSLRLCKSRCVMALLPNAPWERPGTMYHPSLTSVPSPPSPT